jgi:hypothetical protein
MASAKLSEHREVEDAAASSAAGCLGPQANKAHPKSPILMAHFLACKAQQRASLGFALKHSRQAEAGKGRTCCVSVSRRRRSTAPVRAPRPGVPESRSRPLIPTPAGGPAPGAAGFLGRQPQPAAAGQLRRRPNAQPDSRVGGQRTCAAAR